MSILGKRNYYWSSKIDPNSCDQYQVWNDAHEYSSNQKSMSRMVSGLIHRCKEHIFVCTTSTNEQGIESHGPLLRSVQKILKHSVIKIESNDI